MITVLKYVNQDYCGTEFDRAVSYSLNNGVLWKRKLDNLWLGIQSKPKEKILTISVSTSDKRLTDRGYSFTKAD